MGTGPDVKQAMQCLASVILPEKRQLGSLAGEFSHQLLSAGEACEALERP